MPAASNGCTASWVWDSATNHTGEQSRSCSLRVWLTDVSEGGIGHGNAAHLRNAGVHTLERTGQAGRVLVHPPPGCQCLRAHPKVDVDGGSARRRGVSV
jgi:hypothetical protein